MNVLFVCSGNRGLSPITKNQGDSLEKIGIAIQYFLIQGKGVKGYIRNARLLRQKLTENRFDVVHAHYSLSAFAASLAGAKPLVVSLMGSDVKARGLYKFIIKAFSYFFRWRKIIVKSEDMKESLGMADAEIIPNGVNVDRFCVIDKKECQRKLGWCYEKKHVLFPSDPARYEKNFNLLQKSVDLIDDSNIEIHCLIDIPNEQTPLWYNASDVVAMSSLWEGSPNAIKEAMACRRPIVTTNVGDVAFNLSNLEGCYVADNSTEHYASLLRKALLFDANTMGRERIDQLGLSSQQIASRLSRLYYEVAKNQK